MHAEMRRGSEQGHGASQEILPMREAPERSSAESEGLRQMFLERLARIVATQQATPITALQDHGLIAWALISTYVDCVTVGCWDEAL
jgi:hypothetical protein